MGVNESPIGTWGRGTFQDDVACDWLEDLLDSDPILFFRECLNLNGCGELGHVACVGIVCTAEIMLALLGDPRGDLPEAARSWIDDHAHLSVDFLVADALVGLSQVLGEQSEMRIRWEDSDGQYDDWRGHVQDLVNRLAASQTSGDQSDRL